MKLSDRFFNISKLSLLVFFLLLITHSIYASEGKNDNYTSSNSENNNEVISMQQREIRGTVTDAATNEELPGVNIFIKGTTKGESTDIDGKYTIRANTGDVLVFSYLGYKTKEVTIGSNNKLDVKMETDATLLDELVIKGISASQRKALNIKKKAATFVDAVSATDVGKLPDQNIAEALQRVPGITIQRSRGEGDFVSLRGLGPEFVRGSLNGRSVLSATETFDAQLAGGIETSTGRATNFDILPSEVINTLVVSKSPSASQIEGGIAGTVDVKTRKPLQLGNKSGISVQGFHREFAETFDPNISGYISTANESNTFGFLGSISYSNRTIREDFSRTFGLFNIAPGAPGDFNNDGTADSNNNLWFPLSNNNEIYTEDRDRFTALGSFQYKPNQTTDISLDIMYSRRDIDYVDRNFIFLPIPFLPNPNLVQNPDGSVQVDGLARDDIFFNIPSTLRPEATTDEFKGRDELYSIGFNIEKRFNDWTLKSDISYSRATGDLAFDRIRIDANNAQNLDFTTLYGPNGFNITQNAGDDLGSASSYVVAVYESRIRENEDSEFAIKFDAKKELDAGILSSIETGIRYRTRKKELGSGQLNGIAGNFNLTDVPGGFDTGFDNFFKGEWDSTIDFSRLIFPNNDAIRNYVSSDPSLENTPIPVITSGTAFEVLENTFASYVQLNLDGKVGDIPITGNVGFRLVGTDQTVSGARPTVIIEDKGRTDTTVRDIVLVGESEAVSSSSLFVNFLPSINLNIEASKDFFIRMAASKTMTRPTFISLNPAFSATDPGPDINNDGFGTFFEAGNPSLKPSISSNADIGLEYYFNKKNALYFSVFYKEIDDYIATSRTELATQIGGVDIGLIGRNLDNNGTPTDPSDDPDPAVVVSEGVVPVDQLVQPDNQGIAQIGGLEIGYVQSFENGFGYNLNATFARTTASFAATGEEIDFPGVSEFGFNGSVYYEKGGFQTRLAYSYRDDYLLVPNAFGGNFFADAYGQLDASASYSLNDKITLFGSAVNLTDARQQIYVTPTDVNQNAANQFISESVVGLRFSLGMRATF